MLLSQLTLNDEASAKFIDERLASKGDLRAQFHDFLMNNKTQNGTAVAGALLELLLDLKRQEYTEIDGIDLDGAGMSTNNCCC